ncbi:MAG TPA: 23S rRNA (pseudouridine(1915)-N(3))-methyltransferase RlmH [Thermoanaerobaculia bacterium]|nr:23S rRNA (pseudouridine(1915)-N(3))-methyltransferase RlmH [Thermoanaerobaculia bacterium]
MKFQLIWVGSTADIEFRAAAERYLGRIGRFFPIEIREVAPEKSRQKKNDEAIIRAESARLMAAIPPRGTTVVLDQRGDLTDSLRFAKWLETNTVHNPYGVHFVLGGDLGLDQTVRQRADRLLALSPMTLPHELARIVLLEQIYRACTIMRNVPYHK